MRARDASTSVLPLEFQQEAARQQFPQVCQPFHTWCFTDATPWADFYRTGAGYLIRFCGLADFQISSDGQSVTCWPAPNVSSGTVQHLFQNQVVPLARSRAGKLMFHAGAVEIGGSCVAFLGESGRGKSTLTASFATSGTPFLTDDGLLVEICGEKCVVLPSHPSIRLWADSQQALIASAELAPPVHYTPKGRLVAGDNLVYCTEPRVLRSVYVLGPGHASAVQFTKINPAAALIELVRHSFLLDIDASQVLASHFDQLTELVRRAVFYHLDYPRRFERLAEVRAAIVAQTMSDR